MVTFCRSRWFCFKLFCEKTLSSRVESVSWGLVVAMNLVSVWLGCGLQTGPLMPEEHWDLASAMCPGAGGHSHCLATQQCDGEGGWMLLRCPVDLGVRCFSIVAAAPKAAGSPVGCPGALRTGHWDLHWVWSLPGVHPNACMASEPAWQWPPNCGQCHPSGPCTKLVGAEPRGRACPRL